MAKEIQAAHTTAGRVLYALVRSATSTIWKTTSSSLVSYATVDRANYAIAATEEGTASRYYVADFPAAPAGVYSYVVHDQLGASPAENDPPVSICARLVWSGSAVVDVAASDKTGFSLASTGLDAIAVTAPTGVATTFPQMVVQLWRRFFKKSVLSRGAGTLKTYADDGATVITTQTVSSASGVETQGGAT